jgi:homoserine dehydrogenase
MKTIPLCLVGFGNVGQAFAHLLMQKKEILEKKYKLQFIITAIATGQHGAAIDPAGLDVEKAIQMIQKGFSLNWLSKKTGFESSSEIIAQSGAEVMLENSPVNYDGGQPAIEHITTALSQGMHVLTANKGAILHGYKDLNKLAVQKNKRFLFESTVMDGAPIFSLFHKALPALELNAFEGILNSCTNLLLERMEGGDDFEQAIEYARSIGITETDPSGDIDGWDAAIKTALLVNILMGSAIKLDAVERKGIREIQVKDIRNAKKSGEKWKLICRAERNGKEIKASVAPEKVNSESPFFSVNGTSSFIIFKTDSLPGLGILESNPGPSTTAYGLLSDLLTIYEK